MPVTITPDLLLEGYRAGVFPMAEHRDDDTLFWVDPRRRGVLPLGGFHISRSLARALRRGDYQVTLDADFTAVVDACADRPETWISGEIRRLYLALFARGAAHSLEVWQGRDLVGGVYGVAIGAAFCGESMFSRRTDGSKIALAWLVTHLRAGGFTLFDTQFITPHLGSLGGVEIARAEYHRLLRAALRDNARLDHPLPASGQDVVQRNTQTS